MASNSAKGLIGAEGRALRILNLIRGGSADVPAGRQVALNITLKQIEDELPAALEAEEVVEAAAAGAAIVVNSNGLWGWAIDGS